MKTSIKWLVFAVSVFAALLGNFGINSANAQADPGFVRVTYGAVEPKAVEWGVNRVVGAIELQNTSTGSTRTIEALVFEGSGVNEIYAEIRGFKYFAILNLARANTRVTTQAFNVQSGETLPIKIWAIPAHGFSQVSVRVVAVTVRNFDSSRVSVAPTSSAPVLASYAPLKRGILNVSVRSFTSATEPLIVGFSCGEEPGVTKQYLIRVVGPTLASFGVQNAMRDPAFKVFDSNRVEQLETDGNGNGSGDFASVGAFPLPDDSMDASAIMPFPPGSYTIQVIPGKSPGNENGSGVVLVEVYEFR